MTSDTNKAAVSGQGFDGESSAAGFRGSYKLIHLVDAALYLKPAAVKPADPGELIVETVVVKNRWGPKGVVPPRFRWACWNGRFEPWLPKEVREEMEDFDLEEGL